MQFESRTLCDSPHASSAGLQRPALHTHQCEKVQAAPLRQTPRFQKLKHLPRGWPATGLAAVKAAISCGVAKPANGVSAKFGLTAGTTAAAAGGGLTAGTTGATAGAATAGAGAGAGAARFFFGRRVFPLPAAGAGADDDAGAGAEAIADDELP